MNKHNIFYKLQKDPKYQKILEEERELLEIAIQVANARQKKKITQLQLAKETGMPQSQIARLESGNHNVTLTTLYRVAKALDLRLKLAN